jgi:hypothetical protein
MPQALQRKVPQTAATRQPLLLLPPPPLLLLTVSSALETAVSDSLRTNLMGAKATQVGLRSAGKQRPCEPQDTVDGCVMHPKSSPQPQSLSVTVPDRSHPNQSSLKHASVELQQCAAVPAESALLSQQDG